LRAFFDILRAFFAAFGEGFATLRDGSRDDLRDVLRAGVFFPASLDFFWDADDFAFGFEADGSAGRACRGS
jgi:hypothetical protein